jgi:hypothetical protein
MKNSKKKKLNKKCSNCGNTRWRTVIKGKKYVCRKCGKIITKRVKK